MFNNLSVASECLIYGIADVNTQERPLWPPNRRGLCYQIGVHPPERETGLRTHPLASKTLWMSLDKCQHFYFVSMFLKPRHRTAPARFPRPLKKGMCLVKVRPHIRGLGGGKMWEIQSVRNPTRCEPRVPYFELIALQVITGMRAAVVILRTKTYPRHLQGNWGKTQDISTYLVSGILSIICIERTHTFKYKDIYYRFFFLNDKFFFCNLLSQRKIKELWSSLKDLPCK